MVKRSSAWRVLQRIDPHLVHITSPAAYASMRVSGVIEPNDGTRPFTFPQSRDSFASRRRAVALFDFFSPPTHVVAEQSIKWLGFFSCHRPVTLALVISRSGLPSQLINYKQALAAAGLGPMKIPHVELWHPGSIPLSAILRVIALRRDPFRYRSFQPAAPILLAADLLRRLWPNLPAPRDGCELVFDPSGR